MTDYSLLRRLENYVSSSRGAATRRDSGAALELAGPLADSGLKRTRCAPRANRLQAEIFEVGVSPMPAARPIIDFEVDNHFDHRLIIVLEVRDHLDHELIIESEVRDHLDHELIIDF